MENNLDQIQKQIVEEFQTLVSTLRQQNIISSDSNFSFLPLVEPNNLTQKQSQELFITPSCDCSINQNISEMSTNAK